MVILYEEEERGTAVGYLGHFQKNWGHKNFCHKHLEEFTVHIILQRNAV